MDDSLPGSALIIGVEDGFGLVAIKGKKPIKSRFLDKSPLRHQKFQGRRHFGIGQDFILGEKILNPIKW
jgi:hypothetical protein